MPSLTDELQRVFATPLLKTDKRDDPEVSQYLDVTQRCINMEGLRALLQPLLADYVADAIGGAKGGCWVRTHASSGRLVLASLHTLLEYADAFPHAAVIEALEGYDPFKEDSDEES